MTEIEKLMKENYLDGLLDGYRETIEWLEGVDQKMPDKTEALKVCFEQIIKYTNQRINKIEEWRKAVMQ